MSETSSEQKRTLANAEKAFAFIAKNELLADPHTYEVAYTYASRVMPQLIEEVDAAVAADGRLRQEKAAEIYAKLFAPAAQAVDNAGEKVAAELAKIIGMLSTAAGAAEAEAEAIAAVRAGFAGAAPDALHGAIETLAASARRMHGANSELKDNLDDSRREIERLQADLETVRENSLKDPLTQVFNRKFFDDTLVKEMADEERSSLALVMIDIDHFKRFNDTYGHVIGDQVLRVVAGVLRSNCKGKDTVARYGGEEFGVILPETSLKQAEHVANSIRRAVMDKELKKKSTGESLGRVTMSMGVAVLREGDTAESFVARADRALYAAKHTGRNRVICETDPEFDDAARAA